MRKELLLAGVIYFVTIFTLLLGIYRFVETWQLSTLNVFLAGALVLLVAIGWGYVLTALIFAPSKKMENTLSDLTYNIIHELNIPLATIKANTSMLKKGMEDEKSLKRLGRIEDASVRLEKLYNELVYSIRKEIHTIQKERFDLHTLLEERIAIFEEQGRNRFEIDVPQYEIEVDKIGFEQMFDNIISNAMKYSAKESLISIVLDEHTLSIIDRGVGMSSTELLQVYERYFQADTQKEGVGIGLNLVKAYCDEVGIDIRIISQKDEGTKVMLNLAAIHS